MPRKSPTAEIIAIGNELLIGHTLDTNSHWMAKQLRRNGWSLERITVLRDSLKEIDSGVRESLNRNPDLIITVGGLGPTHDDMTMKGIALAIDKPLVLNQLALQMVKKKYENLDPSTPLTSYRRKMATLPRGGASLPNPVGTAPGVLTRVRKTVLVSLPGVPSEMKAIFKSSLISILKTAENPPREIHVNVSGIIESALAPFLSRAHRLYPGLYFKSHPKGRENRAHSIIQVHIYNLDRGSEKKIPEAVTYLLHQLSRLPS